MRYHYTQPNHRWAARLAGAAIVAAGLLTLTAGCGPDSTPAQPSDAPTATVSEPETTATPEVSEPTADLSLDGTQVSGRHVAAGTDVFVMWGDDPADVATAVAPLSGQIVTLEPALDVEEELTDRQYAVYGTGVDSGVLVVGTLRTEASGLNAASRVIAAVTFSAADGWTPSTPVVLDTPEVDWTLLGGSGATVALADGDDHTHAYSVASGEQLWTSERIAAGGDDHVIVDTSDPYTTCPTLRGLDLDTGDVLWKRPAADLIPAGGRWVEIGGGSTAKQCPSLTRTVRVEARPNGLGYLVNPVNVGSFNFENQVMFDLTDGHLVSRAGMDLFYDANSGVVVTASADSHTDGADLLGMVVYDVADGDVALEVDAEQAETLGLEVYGAADGKVWIVTTDEHAIVDAATGDKIGQWDDGDYPISSGNGWYLTSRLNGPTPGGTVDGEVAGGATIHLTDATLTTGS